MIDFTHSGNDTVEFHATAVGTHLLADTAHNYNNVLASTTVNPTINISVGGIPSPTTQTPALGCSRRCDDCDPLYDGHF